METTQAAAANSARFDIYCNVHKGLRAFMSDTLMRVARMNPDDPGERDPVLFHVRQLLEILDAHIEHENEHVHPAIEARCAGASQQIAGEHESHRQAIARVEARLEAISNARQRQARGAAALALYRELALFIGENFEHMEMEESMHNSALWAAYTDDEIHLIHQRLLSAVDPAQMAVFLRWIVPNLSHPERCEMLGGMQQGMPPEAFEQVLELVRSHLGTRDWGKLSSALALEPAAA